MRVLVVLCLLLAVCNGSPATFSWNGMGWGQSGPDVEVCLANHAACGCCLMNTQIRRMKELFNHAVVAMDTLLSKSKTAVNEIKNNRSAFSVALNNDQHLRCLGAFNTDEVIQYKHVFINSGDGYDLNTGIYTAPYSGVYSVAATIYISNFPGQGHSACASLWVNGAATRLVEKFQGDKEDSNTVVMAVKLKAGDQMSVVLLKGCLICDDQHHYNTFTGFLVYLTDEMS